MIDRRWFLKIAALNLLAIGFEGLLGCDGRAQQQTGSFTKPSGTAGLSLPRGVYAVTNTANWVIKDGQRVNLFDYSFIDGLNNYTRWAEVEPQKGNYSWVGFERLVKEADAANKALSYNIIAGEHAPDWVYGEPGILGLQRLSCGGGDTSKKTYLPWVVENGRRSLNTPFLRIWDKTVTAFAEFIHSHPLKGRVSYIAITGGPTSNGLEIMWNSNFSSPDLNWDSEAEDLFIRFWKGVIDIFIKNFPEIPLGLAFTDIFGSNALCKPGRNTDIPGRIVNYALKSAEANKAAVVPMGLWLGNISPANLRGHPLVRLMESFNAPFAYQGHLFTATKEGLQAMLDFAVEERAPWVELWHSDIINDGYAGIIKEARNRLLSAG